MFLEAQFGQSITPIAKSKLVLGQTNGLSAKTGSNGVKSEPNLEDADEETIAELEASELHRLHSIGIPVPGIEVKVDKYVAKIWLETLEVECASQVFAQRVKAVIDRAVETIAPLWSEQSGASKSTSKSKAG